MPHCSLIKQTCLEKKEKMSLKSTQLLLGYLKPDTIWSCGTKCQARQRRQVYSELGYCGERAGIKTMWTIVTFLSVQWVQHTHLFNLKIWWGAVIKTHCSIDEPLVFLSLITAILGVSLGENNLIKIALINVIIPPNKEDNTLMLLWRILFHLFSSIERFSIYWLSKLLSH